MITFISKLIYVCFNNQNYLSLWVKYISQPTEINQKIYKSYKRWFLSKPPWVTYRIRNLSLWRRWPIIRIEASKYIIRVTKNLGDPIKSCSDLSDFKILKLKYDNSSKSDLIESVGK